MTSLANFFDDSSRAAARLGPQTGILSRSRASTRPAASGASGPTTTRSTASWPAIVATPPTLLGSIPSITEPSCGQAGIPGKGHKTVHSIALPELPADGVLPPTAANQQDPHLSIN